MIVLERYDGSQKLLRGLHRPDGCFKVVQRVVGLRMMIVLERYDGSQILLRLRGLYRPGGCFGVAQSIAGLGMMIVQLQGEHVSLCRKRVSFESRCIKAETIHGKSANLPQDTA